MIQVSPDQFLDPRWRLSNLYWITDKGGKRVRFEPNAAQLEFLDNVHVLNLILKARQLGFCLDPTMRVLTADLRWVPIGSLVTGQEIVAVDEHPPGGRGSGRKMRTAIVEAAAKVQRKAYRITFNDGRSVVCTGQHPWLSRKVATDAKWRSIDGTGTAVVGTLKIGTRVRWVTKPWDDGGYEDGWMGGFLDGEGSISKTNVAASLNVSQVAGPAFDRAEAYLRERGYNYRIEHDAMERPSKYGKIPVDKLVIGRMDEMFRLVGQTRPARFLRNRFWEGRELPGKRNGGVGWVTIAKIEELGDQTMIDLQTSTGTYIAEGFVSHNTTLCCLVYLDACIFTPNTRAGVIAHKLDDARVIFRDKIKFPFDHLDEGIKAKVRTVQDSADTLTLANNSNIRVSTSMRSGTLQYLHISEFGKICALYPEKAREIVTGALNAVEVGQFVTIESTAEGQEGRFYEMTQAARARKAAGTALSSLDYKFHFFPWHQDPNYVLHDEAVVIGDDDARYFDTLEEQGIKLALPQKRWWVKKAETQGGDMKREYPATPDEAFEQALEGAYFTRELFVAAKQGRIGGFPFVPKHPVNTFWDLGRNDLNTLWLHQHVNGFNRFIAYYENAGEHISHYVRWLKAWGEERNAVLGDHYWPHDGDRESLWLEDGTLGVARGLGFNPRIVERPRHKLEAVSAARAKFATSQFDEAGCALGLKRLRSYRKDWDEERGVWKDRPRHDEASHGADGYMTFACSNYAPPTTGAASPKPKTNWVV